MSKLTEYKRLVFELKEPTIDDIINDKKSLEFYKSIEKKIDSISSIIRKGADGGFEKSFFSIIYLEEPETNNLVLFTKERYYKWEPFYLWTNPIFVIIE